MKKQRKKHCDYAVLNDIGRCIAACYYNVESNYEYDCIGIKRRSNAEIIKMVMERKKEGIDI